MDRRKDYYADLDVTPAETVDGIQRAYRRLAKRYHPDHAGAQSAERFRAVQEAYQVLSDPRQRQQYDRMVRPRRSEAAATPEPLVPPRPHRHRPEPFSPLHSAFSHRHEGPWAESAVGDELKWTRIAASALLLVFHAPAWGEGEESPEQVSLRDPMEWWE